MAFEAESCHCPVKLLFSEQLSVCQSVKYALFTRASQLCKADVTQSQQDELKGTGQERLTEAVPQISITVSLKDKSSSVHLSPCHIPQ